LRDTLRIITAVHDDAQLPLVFALRLNLLSEFAFERAPRHLIENADGAARSGGVGRIGFEEDLRAVAARGSSGAALGLYPAWCAFATLLSTRIWQLNRD